ncbi:39 kDa FK506-binding nuclear protein-like [Drosophila miranda]|uniref:39 kDa FK506-binding nuclear protein-like n=1 Tax=Drosophila miranda TaxID=7229 RepID=UPI0007E692B0|nr:39 kDa FK506-binding nuclear protein-like [Drosophila miranda]
MSKLALSHFQSPRFSKLYMKPDYTYTPFLKKPIHLANVTLDQGIWAKLWLKTKSNEKILADLRECSPKVSLDIDVHPGEILYLESNGTVMVTLVGCMRELEHGMGSFRMEDCFITATKWVKCEVQNSNPFA